MTSNGYVYAAFLEHLPDVIKIGCSRDVGRREQEGHLDVFYVEEDILFKGGSGYIKGYKEQLALEFAKQIGIWHSPDYMHSLPDEHPLEIGWTEYIRFNRRAQTQLADNLGEAFEEIRDFFSNLLRTLHREDEFGRLDLDEQPAAASLIVDDHERAEFDDGDEDERAEHLDYGPSSRVSFGAMISSDPDPDASDDAIDD